MPQTEDLSYGCASFLAREHIGSGWRRAFLQVKSFPAGAPIGSVQPAASSLGSWQIPSSWAVPLGYTLRLAGIAYLLVLGYLLFTHIKRQRHLKWVLRFTSIPPAEVAETFRSLAQSLRVRRSRLLVLPGVTSPATFGWIRPIILLPDVCLEQGPSELEDILRHELHHVRRWDFFWNGFAVLWRALLFFHPASWYAVRKMQLDRELACDLAVISQAPARRVSYAECLIRFARLNLPDDSKNWGVDFAASQHLKARIRYHPGWPQQASWLVTLPACGIWTDSGCWFLGIVPSMAVLVSYAHQQISRPLMSAPVAPPPSMKTRLEQREGFEQCHRQVPGVRVLHLQT